MTVEELITSVLLSIRNHFYADRPRDYMRDERALMKAIARYGYECNQRGWDFDTKHILFEITDILRSMREKQAEIKYLPLYLAGAVTRHIGQRAEELSAKAKSVPRNVAKVVQQAGALPRAEVIRTPSATETLAGIFGELNAMRRRKKLQAVKPVKEGSLL